MLGDLLRNLYCFSPLEILDRQEFSRRRAGRVDRELGCVVFANCMIERRGKAMRRRAISGECPR